MAYSPKDHRSIVIPQDLWDKIVAAAKKDDRSISSWIRKTAEAILKQESINEP